MTPTLESDHFRRRWRILPRVQLEIVRYIHYYHAGDRRFVWQVRIIYDTLRNPSGLLRPTTPRNPEMTTGIDRIPERLEEAQHSLYGPDMVVLPRADVERLLTIAETAREAVGLNPAGVLWTIPHHCRKLADALAAFDTETGASTATQPLTPTPHASYPQPPRT